MSDLKIKDWWMNLALREKRIVAGGGIALSIIILYTAIISPYFSYVNNLRQRIASSQKTLTWMQTADKEINQQTQENTPHQKTMSPVALLSFMQNEIKEAQLEQFVTQLKQASNNNAIEIHFQKIEFDKMMRLILRVAQHGIRVAQLTTVADAAPGVVNADVMLHA